MSTPASLSGVGGLFTGFTRLSKALTLVLVIGYLVTFLVPSTLRYLALVPGKTIPFAWNLITAGYVEKSAFTLIMNALALLFLGKSLEPVWGSKEFFWFIVVVNTWTAISTFAILIVLYYSTLQDQFLYGTYCGFHGVVAGFLVGIKQLMPDQEITLLYMLRFRAKWVPSLFVLLSTIICVALGKTAEYVPFIVFGTFISWIYLRFYQTKSEGTLKGDPSDEFVFATFFPEFLRPVVGTIAALVGRIFCGRRPAVANADDPSFLNKPLPGSDPAEASRRRERGARALEERLNLAKPSEDSAPDAPVAGVDLTTATVGDDAAV